MLLQWLQEAIRSTKERRVSRNKLPGMAVGKGDRGSKKLRNLSFVLSLVAVSLFVDLKFNPFTPNPSHPAHDRLSFRFSLTLRRLMSYIYGAPILDVSRSHTTTQHSR